MGLQGVGALAAGWRSQQLARCRRHALPLGQPLFAQAARAIKQLGGSCRTIDGVEHHMHTLTRAVVASQAAGAAQVLLLWLRP